MPTLRTDVAAGAIYGTRKIKEIAGLSPDNVFSESETQEHELGRVLELDDGLGRTFRYCKNGAVALSAGYLVQAPAPIANHKEHVGGAGTTGALGASEIVIGLTMTTALTAKQYNRGFIHCNLATGIGHAYEIVKHTNSVTPTITIGDEGGIRVAVDTTTEFTLTANPHNGVIVAPTTLTAQIIGIPLIAVTASYYFWAQVKGPAPAYVDTADTIVVGENVGYPTAPAVAGAVGLPAVTDQVVGRVMQANVAGEVALIDLTLP